MMIEFLDVEYLRRLCPGLIPDHSLEDDEIFELLLNELQQNGSVAFRLEWDSGGPGAGAGTETIFWLAHAFFTVSVDFGIKGPFESFDLALKNTVPISADGRVIITESSRSLHWPGADVRTLIGRLDFTHSAAGGYVNLNGAELRLQDLKQISSVTTGVGRLGPGALLMGVASPSIDVRKVAVSLLRQIARARFPEEDFQGSLGPVLREEWTALRAIGVDPARDLLSVFCTEESLLSMEYIALALAADHAGATELLRLLASEDFVFRHKAAVGLGALDGTAQWAIPEILHALREESQPLVVINLVHVLGRIGGAKATEVLSTIYMQQRNAPEPDVPLLQALERALSHAQLQDVK